ncbi:MULTISPECIES: hypothetical protein [unclassified Rhizobium]|uniref:hypothetical protein n=1 Tax=unclassified Rhizobium TaxID=2613769 RepID=UPI0018EA2A76|nr:MULTISPECIES: hypothetical protein [unclassified Rhizobium]MDM9623026.1 hypothetical protein [Rhizobium sp. S96]
MEFINRFVDQPMLQGASWILQVWHRRSGRSPDALSPVWNLVVISFLLGVNWRFMIGTPGLLTFGALVMLSLPSVLTLLSKRDCGQYDARSYRAMATVAIRKRETEWVVRVLVLLISACLPMLAGGGDEVGKVFVLGAGLWFALTVPASAYLAAAEPPKPNDGDSVYLGRRVVEAA